MIFSEHELSSSATATEPLGVRFSQEDLRQLPLLGDCVRLQFRHAWLSLLSDALSRHPVAQSEFLVMLSSVEAYADSPLYVLRVEDWEEPGLTITQPSTVLLRCAILGSFTPPDKPQADWGFTSRISLNQLPHGFHVHVPSPEVLHALINGTLTRDGQFDFGHLRYNEHIDTGPSPITARIAISDMVTKRTAMLGKTRLGKSNVVKLIAQSMLDYTQHTHNVGQLLFDVSGEYSNTNPADGEVTLASLNPQRCSAYFLTERQGNADGRLLRFNFYQIPGEAFAVMRELLPTEALASAAVTTLLTCRMPEMTQLAPLPEVEKVRRLRKVMLFWAVLDAAGFEHDSDRLKAWMADLGVKANFNPGFGAGLRQAAYQAVANAPPPAVPHNMRTLMTEVNTIAKFRHVYSNDPHLMVNGAPLFDNEEDILMSFISSGNGQHPYMLRPCLIYHSAKADDFEAQIMTSLDEGRTVIIDLSNATDQVVRYFAQKICWAIFASQEHKFKLNTLTGRYVQIYFEEAHDIFPIQGTLMTQVYSRFAKEGAKFHIGIAYATQSPSTLSPDLLAQTENFFIGHLSSQKEVDCLCELQVAFQGCENAIRFNRTPGLMQVLTHSHRYVVPIQAQLFPARPMPRNAPMLRLGRV